VIRVRLRGLSQLNLGPHQKIGIKILIKEVKWIGLANKRGKTNQAIVDELSELQPYTKVVKWNPL
jgi:hypothetical protein